MRNPADLRRRADHCLVLAERSDHPEIVTMLQGFNEQLLWEANLLATLATQSSSSCFFLAHTKAA